MFTFLHIQHTSKRPRPSHDILENTQTHKNTFTALFCSPWPTNSNPSSSRVKSALHIYIYIRSSGHQQQTGLHTNDERRPVRLFVVSCYSPGGCGCKNIFIYTFIKRPCYSPPLSPRFVFLAVHALYQINLNYSAANAIERRRLYVGVGLKRQTSREMFVLGVCSFKRLFRHTHTHIYIPHIPWSETTWGVRQGLLVKTSQEVSDDEKGQTCHNGWLRCAKWKASSANV